MDSGDESALAPKGGETCEAELELRSDVEGSAVGAPYLSLGLGLAIALSVVVVLGAPSPGRLECRDVVMLRERRQMLLESLGSGKAEKTVLFLTGRPPTLRAAVRGVRRLPQGGRGAQPTAIMLIFSFDGARGGGSSISAQGCSPLPRPRDCHRRCRQRSFL